MQNHVILMCLVSCLMISACAIGAEPAPPPKDHAYTADFPICNDAFQYGFTNNRVTDTVDGRQYPLLCIQSVNEGKRVTDLAEKRFFSCWTRDVYWGFLGMSQIGGQEVAARLKGSIELLLLAKARNLADGTNKNWPCSDGRYYIPQAFLPGATPAKDFYPYDGESQAQFILIVHLYWKLTGDDAFLRSIWDEVAYVMETVRLMDTNGNALPDRVWGSYDYQGVGPNTEEPLMCATAAGAFQAYAELADALGDTVEACQARTSAEAIRTAMNKPTEQGGLWKSDAEGGYYVNMRHIETGNARVDDRFIPYENLVPMYFGIPSPDQTEAIFKRLDAGFDTYYLRKNGPMYVAPIVATNEKTVEDCSTTPWLGFLDVYLRSKTGAGSELNRQRIFALLLAHAYDVDETPFSEGLGITGSLTGGAGRQWDNGNFFHCLINGIYGIEKTKDGLIISPPAPVEGFAFSRLDNVKWRDATYTFLWKGSGKHIASVKSGWHKIAPEPGTPQRFVLTKAKGHRTVVIELQ